MNTQRRPALWLAGLALGTLLALLIAPQTRWLVRVQWAASLGLYHPFPWDAYQPGMDAYTLSLRGDQARESAVAARHPQDLQIQLAYAVYGTHYDERLARVRGLRTRYPNSAALDANALRYAMLPDDDNAVEHLLILRDAHDEHAMHPDFPLPNMGTIPHSSEALAQFDKDAAEGERLEPDNAYFPFMRSVGLFAANRDAEALAAIRRAGMKTGWDEHLADEPTGVARLHAEAFGDPNALWRSQVMNSVMVPEYSALRAVTRIATYQAVWDEQAGHAEDGLAIRRALMRCGGLMRAKSSQVLGSLVGIAITYIATYRPGGGPAAHYRSSIEADRRRIADYAAYARKIGHADEARWALSEAQASAQTRADIEIASHNATSSPVNSLLFRPSVKLSRLWVADFLVISNILWALVLGGVSTLFHRKRSPDQIVPARKLWSVILAGVLSAFGLGLLIVMAHWQTEGVVSFARFNWVLLGLPNGDTNEFLNMDWVTRACMAVSLALPLLVALVSLVVGFARRLPFWESLRSGFRSAALPAAAILLLIYGGLTLATLRQERAVNDTVTRTLSGEGRYWAELTGQTWPGVTR